MGAAYTRGILQTAAAPAASSQPTFQPVVVPIARQEDIPDDRDDLDSGEPVLMVVEDDPHYARVLVNLARERGFKVILARTGADALIFARRYPLSAVSLDVFLPDMLGWTVLNQLKRSSETRHIPVQVLTIEDERQYGLERGAFAFLTKTGTTEKLEAALDRLKEFTSAKVRRLLVVEDDPAEQLSVTELLGHQDIEIVTATTGAEALKVMRDTQIDCVVLDLRLPDMSGFELLEVIQLDAALRHLPIIVFTGRDISDAEESRLKKTAKSIVLKGVRSPERLLDETALFLHRVVADLPPAKQSMLKTLHESDEPLTGRKVLVVDDDIRNIFALNSLLERHHMQVITATNGRRPSIWSRAPRTSRWY
ncbi:MAG: response regulator [Steroidobacteraceae bacterium]